MILLERITKHARALAVIASSSSFVILSTFARGVILARILGPSEYGLAVLLITISAGLDLFIDGGVDQYLVRSRFGYRKDVLATAQAYRFMGALTAAALLSVIAPSLASFVDAPELRNAIYWISGATVLRSLTSLDYKIQQRKRVYTREVYIDISRVTCELMVMTIVALLTKSYWSVISGLYVNSLVQVAISRIAAERQTKICFHRRAFLLLGKFSLPIIGNSFILFAATQGDRLLISSLYSPRSVALYAAACSMGQAATALISRVTNSLFLPLFGASRPKDESMRRSAGRVTIGYIGFSTIIASVLVVFAPILIEWIYGPAFSGLRLIVFASACVQMIQMEQGWLTTLMVGAGATRSFPLITSIRALSLPAAMIVISPSSTQIVAVPCALAVGTYLSLLYSYFTVYRIGVVSTGVIWLGVARGVTVLGVLFGVTFPYL